MAQPAALERHIVVLTAGATPLLLGRVEKHAHAPTTLSEDLHFAARRTLITAPGGALGIPAETIRASLVAALGVTKRAPYFPDPSLSSTRGLAKAMRIDASFLHFPEGTTWLPHIQRAHKGNVVVMPKFDIWSITIPLLLFSGADEEVLRDTFVHAGRSGIGEYCPIKGGVYGRFVVTSWTLG